MIEIRTLHEEDLRWPRGKIRVTVTDNGEGIAASNMQDIFSEGYSTRVGAGRGFGLAITKRLAERNQGSVEIYSPPQTIPRLKARGTEVVLEFPRVHCFNTLR